jgi:hypothetical protein
MTVKNALESEFEVFLSKCYSNNSHRVVAIKITCWLGLKFDFNISYLFKEFILAGNANKTLLKVEFKNFYSFL